MFLRDIKETLEESLQIGYESLIPIQKDTDFIKEMNEVFIKILDNVMFYLSKEGIDIDKITYKDTVKINNKINDSKLGIKEIIKPQLKYLSNILFKRFNIPVKIKLDNSSDTVVHSIYTIYEPKIINQYMSSMSKVEKDLNKMLINGKVDSNTYKRLSSLKTITESILNNKFSINLKTLKVEGLDKTDFIIYLNLTNALVNKLNPMVLTTCIIKEIARYFSMLNKLYKTHKVSLSYYKDLADIDERQIDKLKVIIENRLKINIDNDPNSIILAIKEYMLRYEEDIKNAIPDRTDEDIIEKEFISALGLSAYYDDCVIANNTKIRSNNIYKIISSLSFLTIVILIVKAVINLFFPFGWILTAVVLGVMTIWTPEYVTLLFVILTNMFNIFLYIFNLGLNANIKLINADLTTKTLDYSSIKTELTNYKKVLIRRLRTDGLDRDERLILIDNIKNIENLIEITNNNIGLLSRVVEYAKTNNIDLIDSLKDNDLHYLSEVIKIQGVK